MDGLDVWNPQPLNAAGCQVLSALEAPELQPLIILILEPNTVTPPQPQVRTKAGLTGDSPELSGAFFGVHIDETSILDSMN